VRWVDREPPLAPSGVAPRGDAARELAAKLADRGDLRGVAGAGLVVVLGTELPWVDGAIWLGVDPLAPGLYLPTTRRPEDPIEWVEAAVLREVSRPAALLEDGAVVPLAAARPIGDAAFVADALRRTAG
jgi:hypothetical protein